MATSGVAASTSTRRLRGVYAYSYSGRLRASNPLAHSTVVGHAREHNLVDRIGARTLIGFVGWVDFHGDGTLNGIVTAERAGEKIMTFIHGGDYCVDDAATADGKCTSGTFTTRTDAFSFTHEYIVRQGGKEIEFTVVDDATQTLVATGFMTWITSTSRASAERAVSRVTPRAGEAVMSLR